MTWGRYTVDLAVLDPTDWRRAIEDEFETLGPGDSLLLCSRHDPAAILAACRSVCGECFTWEAIEEGPAVWRYEIRDSGACSPREVITYLQADHGKLNALLQEVDHRAVEGDELLRQRFAELRRGLERHIRQEEEVLFPAFERRTGLSDGPTRLMRQEHVAIRQALRDADATLSVAGDAVGALRGLRDLWQQHEDKEEQILYPMTSHALSQAERVELMKAMADL